MSKVISKVRCYNPNQSDTTKGNINHLFYIARRKMALANENCITTFGVVEGVEVERVSVQKLAKIVGEKSDSKTNIYRGMISLKESDALELGFDKQVEWKEMMERNIYDIAKTLGIPPLNSQWIGAVHWKKNNPHIHYILWDKAQQINDCYISTKQQIAIKNLVTKDIFEGELKKYYEIQDEVKKKLKDKKVELEFKAFNIKNCTGKIA